MLVKIVDQLLSGEEKHSLEVNLNENTTPKEIIKARVAEEVTAYNTKAKKVFNGLVQPTEIESMLNNRKEKFKAIDVEKQIYVALDAFQKNDFFILVDNSQVSDLDEKVTLKATSQINFIKLTPLVGG